MLGDSGQAGQRIRWRTLRTNRWRRRRPPVTSSPVLRRAVVLVALSLVVVSSCGELDDDAYGAVDADGRDAPATWEWIDDPDCDEETIGDDDGEVAVALVVRDGAREGICAGEPDGRLDDAWDELVAIVPSRWLDDVGVFAGFDDPDADVLAFVAPLGELNERFVISVNLALSDDDPDQLRLTLAHEIAHVFSQTPDQLDVDVPPEDCPTFHNGNGCFLDGSLVLEWIEQFWSEEQLASIPDTAEADEIGAERRCLLDRSFLGAYAASSPEEDLAESFSAFVFDLDVPAAVRPRLEFFAARPHFGGFRELADADERQPPAGEFDLCGE